MLEMALKIFTFGFDAYWMEGQNCFDFVVTWIIGEKSLFYLSIFWFIYQQNYYLYNKRNTALYFLDHGLDWYFAALSG